MVLKVHVVPDSPLAAPDEALVLKDVDDGLGWHPSVCQRCQHPVGVYVLCPAPENGLALQVFRQDIHCNTQTMEGLAVCPCNEPPVVGIQLVYFGNEGLD